MLDLKFKKIENPEDYQNFLIENNAPFTQAYFYGNWHKKLGKNIHCYGIFDNDKIIFYFQALEMNAPLGKKVLYSPYGPVYKKDRLSDFLPFLKKELKKELINLNAIFFRFDFCPTLSEEDEKKIEKYFYKSHKKTYSGSLFQPRDEWVLDLSIDEDSIYNNFDKKHRYCIRQAEKEKVEVEIITDKFVQYFDEFYELIKETSNRNSFSLHKKDYYREIFEYLDQSKQGYLVRSFYKGDLCDSLLFVNFGNTTMFIFGGSSDKNRSIPTAHLSQWNSILYAKSLGIKFYNFGGISTDENYKESLLSVTRFKIRFGGSIFKHSPFFDLVNNWLLYFIFVIKKIIDNR